MSYGVTFVTGLSLLLVIVVIVVVARVVLGSRHIAKSQRKEHNRDLMPQVCVVDSSLKKADACLGPEDIRAIDDVTAFTSLLPGTSSTTLTFPPSTRLCFGTTCLSTEHTDRDQSSSMVVKLDDNQTTLAKFSSHQNRLTLPSTTTAGPYHYWNEQGVTDVLVPPTMPPPAVSFKQ